MSQCGENTQFVHPGITASASSMYLYQSQPPHHHHHHHHHFHHNHHHHLNTINVNMKIVPPVAASPTVPANYLFPSADDQITYNRNCSSTSTNSSCSSFSNLSCNNSLNNNHCGVVENSAIKKEDTAILDSLYDEINYQPNYYANNSSYQIPAEQSSYLHNSSASSTAAAYYAQGFLKNCDN